MSRITQLWREETAGFHPRLQLARLLLAFLPHYAGNRLRPAVLRAAGFKIGPGTIMMGTPTFTGTGDLARRLVVGQQVWFNIGVLINLGDAVTIEDRAALGHEVMILTDSHALGPAGRRAGDLYARPVRIGAGAWLGARAIILPGVTVGPGAVVAAGAVVSRDVPANNMVGGVPARLIKELGT